MRRIALRLPDDGVWTGGVNYIETVCRALLENPDLGYEPCVFCSPEADRGLLQRFEELLGPGLIRDPYMKLGRRASLASAVIFGRNRRMAELCVRNRCDVMVEAADFYGWRFPTACLAWIPDFQDKYLPHLFARSGLVRKALGLRLQLASGRTVLVSSEDARKDCEHFYPAARGRVAVARFAVRPALRPGENDPGIFQRYKLPARFFYLPNQFWAHKNHTRVVEALQLLRARNLSVVVASSGNPRDPRQLDYYGRLRAAVGSAGLGESFLFLGEVPRADVAALMRSSVAMINPSLFEGWSTTVEEAKSLGVRMVLSNLAVHREQVGGAADFFNPNDPSAIADSLERVWRDAREAPTLLEQQAAATGAHARILEFAQQLTRACERARLPATAASP
jgi:glycosyltransferase involved in cell wall biosynthesis